MGAVYEACFREHLWRLALAGELGPDVVDVGPWWDTDSQNEIDAVVLAEPELTRIPVLVGEAKWKRRVDGGRIEGFLDGRAAAVGADPERVQHAICAREEVHHVRPGTLVVTADDIFAPGV